MDMEDVEDGLPGDNSQVEGGDFDNNDGIRSTIFGPLLWTYLGCIGRNFPVHPTDTDKYNYHNFLIFLGKTLPCGPCRNNFDKNLQDAGYDPATHLQSRKAFSGFMNTLHNTVSAMLNKTNSNVAFEEHRRFYESFKASCSQASATSEGGCMRSRFANDPKPSVLIHILPEREMKAVARQHNDHSVILDQSCLIHPTCP